MKLRVQEGGPDVSQEEDTTKDLTYGWGRAAPGNLGEESCQAGISYPSVAVIKKKKTLPPKAALAYGGGGLSPSQWRA